MRLLLINSVCGTGSTGRIVGDIAKEYEADGYEVKIAYGRGIAYGETGKYGVKIGNNLNVALHGVKSRLFDAHGLGSKIATKQFLKWAEKYNPDVLWLHNIHGYYINYPLLFEWIKSRPEMQVKWTLHDCWSFTGHCSHFSFVKCNKWQQHCQDCIQYKEYPKSILKDKSKRNFKIKKEAFYGVNNMTIITPSKWLEDLVKKSFLREYEVEVQYNTIDKNIFKPVKSDFRERFHLQDKKIVLGVATSWGPRKGIDDFFKLRELLDNSYSIVLVGLTEKYMKKLLPGMIGIERTNSKQELAEIYSAADVFVNPSREEVFGLTSLEAVSCGTPAIVYKGTACEEVVNEYGGFAVEFNIEALLKKIKEIG